VEKRVRERNERGIGERMEGKAIPTPKKNPGYGLTHVQILHTVYILHNLHY